MPVKPWRTIATPHKDVLEGTFKQSEFAADISQVATGKAQAEYQDAEQFFARTFITEGMRLLLMSVAQRLAGLGGDPVIQLQTAFGGGKTHTMLAVYHLASRQTDVSRLAGIPPLLDAAGIHSLPQAKIAVLDGINLSAAQGKTHGSITAHTLWGEMAYQLAGERGYALVETDDKAGTAPAKDTLIELLNLAAPCVILIDELQKFFSELQPGAHLAAGSLEANLKFIQALSEALKAVPTAVLLASLPESDTETGGSFGQEVLAKLEKHFARVESVWKPVATEEAFEIVRRRLFEQAGKPDEIQAVCRTFYEFYRNNHEFPAEAQSAVYLERMIRAYPIHPEVFDRLYEDWTTLDKFQRTRGVLQYLAVVIHRLWNSNNQDAMIMPGSLPLDDSTVRDKSIHYLPQGWQAVIESEVDGNRSAPHELDGQDTRFGSVHAAHRVMRTIFLGSAPDASVQNVRGIERAKILLGAVQPEQTVGHFSDALARLRDRLHYLYAEQDRYWLDTRPNLRREMETRKNGIKADELTETLKARLSHILGSGSLFAGKHIFTPSSDIPDDFGLRLVILPSRMAYTKQNPKPAYDAAEKIVTKRGEQPRLKRNRLLFLAADGDTTARLYEECKNYLAWQKIQKDIDAKMLNIDLRQVDQVRANKENAEKSFTRTLRETYRWLLNPRQDTPEKQDLAWDALPLPAGAPNLISEIENTAKHAELVVTEWSPVHLRNELEKWYFKENTPDVSALKVWQDSCQYLYMVRLLNDDVFKNTIGSGIANRDFFGFALAKNQDRYEGFNFGKNTIVQMDSDSVLIARTAAEAYAAKLKAEEEARQKPSPATTENTGADTDTPPHTPIPETVSPSAPKAVKRQFFASAQLDPLTGKSAFNSIMEEIVRNLTDNPGVAVNLRLEIHAECPDGFDDSLQRAIRENCNALKIGHHEFE